jgi:hypothetical protein
MSDGYFVSLDLNAETLFDFRLSSQVFRYRVFDIGGQRSGADGLLM